MGSVKSLQHAFEVRCHPTELSRIREELLSLLRQAEIAAATASSFVLAVDEALSATMAYNRAKGFVHDLALAVDVDEVRFQATLTDPMTDFGLDRSYEQLHGDRKYKISFYLMCRVMDEVTYSFRRGFENSLVLVKFL